MLVVAFGPKEAENKEDVQFPGFFLLLYGGDSAPKLTAYLGSSVAAMSGGCPPEICGSEAMCESR